MNYYHGYFVDNSKNISAIWKRIRMVVKIISYSNTGILILDNNGNMETDLIVISNLFNINSMGPKIEFKNQ